MLVEISATDNRAAADRVVLEAGPAGERIQHFDQGEILKGVVREISPDGVISLLINGKLVDAASELNVSPGQQLYLLVDGFRNGLTYLKVITTEGAASLDDNSLSVNQRGIGALSNADAVLITDKLLQYNLPVTPQNIATIFNALNMIGGLTTRNLDMAAFILQHNIPLDKNILPLIDQFVSSDGDLSRLVRELFQLLARMETLVRSDSPSSAAATASAAPALVITAGSSNPANASALNSVLPGTAPASTSNAAPAAAGNAANAGNSASAANATGIANVVSASPQGVSQQGNTASSLLAAAASPTGTLPASQAGTAAANSGVQTASNIAAPAAETAGGAAGSSNNPLIAANTASAAADGTVSAATTGETGSTTAAGQNVTMTTAGEAGSLADAVSRAAFNAAVSAAIITAKSFPAGGYTYQPPVEAVAASADTAAANEAKALELMEFAKVLRTVLDSFVGKIAGSGDDVNLVLQSLVKGRSLLLDNLRQMFDMLKADDTLNKTPGGQELLARIGDIQQQITGQALFNSAVKLGQEVFNNNYYFSFPVVIENELSYCQLRIQKNNNSRLDLQENIKFVVSLETPALGIVMFHIDWHRQGYIQLQGVMETDEAVGFIEKNMEDLLGRLSELGYRVSNLGIKAARNPEELNLKPQPLETNQDKISPFSVDVIA